MSQPRAEKQHERSQLWSFLDEAIRDHKTAEYMTNHIEPRFFLWRDVEIERLERELAKTQASLSSALGELGREQSTHD